MNNLFAFLLFISLSTSCRSQQKIIDSKSKDILIFNLEDDRVQFISDNFNKDINSSNNHILIMQYWSAYGSHYFDKEYFFMKNLDTMSIKCFCGQERNFYFKNLKFKKGDYELKFEIPNKRTFGSKIKHIKDFQRILFKNTYVSPDVPTQRDVYFKNLEFIEVDLSDTINVKLKKVEEEALPKKESR